MQVNATKSIALLALFKSWVRMRSYSAILFLSSNAETQRFLFGSLIEIWESKNLSAIRMLAIEWKESLRFCVSAFFYNKDLSLNSYAYAPSLIYIRYSGMIKNYNLRSRN
jgi:hypothetical protein